MVLLFFLTFFENKAKKDGISSKLWCLKAQSFEAFALILVKNEDFVRIFRTLEKHLGKFLFGVQNTKKGDISPSEG